MKIPFLTPNKITPKTLAHIQWKNVAYNDERKIFEPFSVNKDVIGDVFVDISKHYRGEENLMIQIKNRLGKILGHELMSMDKDKSKQIFGFNIQVEEDYRRKKSFRIGELLRLASIMEMMENKSPHIKIYSKDTAVYFHTKYKFEPDITAFTERDLALQTIIKEKSPQFTDLKEKAEELFDEAIATIGDGPKQRELCQKTNAVLKEYIQRAVLEEKPDQKHPFINGFYMILKNETINKHKDFFNKLFEQQGIDYKI